MDRTGTLVRKTGIQLDSGDSIVMPSPLIALTAGNCNREDRQIRKSAMVFLKMQIRQLERASLKLLTSDF